MVADETSIPFSRIKIALLIAGSAAFVAVCIWLLNAPSTESEVLDRGLGIAGLAFFGLCGAVGIRRLFDRRLALQLSSEGMTDATGAAPKGFIPWSDIQGFGVYKVMSTRILIVKVFDPEKYVARGGEVRQKLNRTNLMLCGSPVTISSTALAISFDDLVRLCESYLSKYGRAA